jgi:hypothetical protein
VRRDSGVIALSRGVKNLESCAVPHSEEDQGEGRLYERLSTRMEESRGSNQCFTIEPLLSNEA